MDCRKGAGTKTAKKTGRKGRSDQNEAGSVKAQPWEERSGREGMIKREGSGVKGQEPGAPEVSLRPERGVVGSETPHRARGVWRPGWLASQTEKRDQKELWRDPKKEAEGLRVRRVCSHKAGRAVVLAAPDAGQKQAPVHSLSRRNEGTGQ